MKPSRIGLFIVAAALSASAFAELPEITESRINPTPPGAKVGAAYFLMSNPNDDTLIVSDVSSPAIKQVEIHLSEVIDDVASMKKQDTIEIPGNQSLEFKHGGYHVMLMGLEAPLMPGDIIPLVFQTNRGEVTTDVRVSETIELPTDNHGDMDHSGMDHSGTDHGDHANTD